MNSLGPERALIFRITHRANLPWILEHGLDCPSAKRQNPNFVEIGSPDLIAKRRTRKVPISPHGTLADYIPFYFTPSSPMLYMIKTGHGVPQHAMEDIVILGSSLPMLQECGVPFVFTDRHAYLSNASFYSDLSELQKLDWTLLRQKNFQRSPNHPERSERYQAEALVHQHVPVGALLGLAVCSKKARSAVDAELKAKGLSLKLIVQPTWFFL
jgi:hypothetical protein